MAQKAMFLAMMLTGAASEEMGTTTVFNGRETRYWLNTKHFTPVFEQGPVALTQLAGPANPPPGLEEHKGDWVVAMEVKVAGGLDTIHIETVDPTTLLAPPNATAPPAAAGALTTMRISVNGKQLMAGEHTPSTLDTTVIVNARRMESPREESLASRKGKDHEIGSGHVDGVDIMANGLHVRIFTSKAHKFADEKLQVLGLHLDLYFVNIDKSAVRGALPELWGLQPMSEATKLLLSKETATTKSPAPAYS